MTFNQVISRIKQIALAQLQVRNFYYGLVSDYLTEKTTRYPSVFLQDSGGNISTSAHATSMNFRMFFVDLVNVAGDTKVNEVEVQSDMLSIAQDIITQMNNGGYQDWRVSAENNFQFVVEENDDMYAGCYIDFNIRIMFKEDSCQIPSELGGYVIPRGADKLVYDLIYTSPGGETSITIPELADKKILLIIRANNPIYKVSSNPTSEEFTWNNTTLGLGVETQPGERLLILYREV